MRDRCTRWPRLDTSTGSPRNNTHVQRLNRVRTHGRQRHPWRLPPRWRAARPAPLVRLCKLSSRLQPSGARELPLHRLPLRVVCRRGAVDAPSIAEPLSA
eukprot:2521334-Prymnesium_polylepis.1